jgi:hypothetical protein
MQAVIKASLSGYPFDHRMLCFFSSRRYWNSPNPSPAGECAPPPPLVPGGGAHSLAREGLGESQFRRGEIHHGTLCLSYKYFVRLTVVRMSVSQIKETQTNTICRHCILGQKDPQTFSVQMGFCRSTRLCDVRICFLCFLTSKTECYAPHGPSFHAL